MFGAMSFFDKLVNGAVIAVIQNFNPLSNSLNASLTSLPTNDSFLSPLNSTSKLNSSLMESIELNFVNKTNIGSDRKISVKTSENFYLQILAFVSGAAVVMTFVALMTILRAKFARKHITENKKSEVSNERSVQQTD